ncbi:membrane protein insertase YidC [Terriglobus saanensis]|uniref:membrane protein insertase YidC n=1 Tax=Terriglobus saanensis TaxID=870903 RepID=UPI0001E50349|nr:membrane protein insertase YidC [Terriglobus saanensis]
MTESRNPKLESGTSRWSVVALMIFMVCISFGLQRSSATFESHAASPHAQQVTAEVAKRPNPTAPSSMNFTERGLFVALAFVQHVVANWPGSWGWAIVLLTVAINLLLLPLRITSMRSGLKMQRIQPEMNAIKDRYKHLKLADPRRSELSSEIAKLQKDHGVNMFGGCLPLLVQMPLLFAFFGMLRKADALRGAGWLWLHDLSSADPHHILPILMILFQLLLQWYTPSPGSDAKQQKITRHA